jgi:hypothetical protein
MRTPSRTTATIAAGAVALAFGAYTIGNQVGGGSASAGGGDPDDGRPCAPRAAFHGLADALGVDQAELRDALGDFHRQHADEREDRFGAGLADALGKRRAKVQQAFEHLRDVHQAALARRLARALGLDADDVGAALGKVMRRDRSDHEPGPADFVHDLARELGVSTDRLRDAFRQTIPQPRLERRGHRGPPRLKGLAKTLDVSPATVRRALRHVWRDARTAHRDELARFLADRFDLPVAKVEKALDEVVPPMLGGGPLRRPGP